MKVKRKIIQIDEDLCNGCGNCILACAEGSLKIVDGVAKVISDNLCDGLGACLGECPEGALTIVEREAEEFDEQAVEAHLAKHARQEKEEAPAPLACGCPSATIQTLVPKEKLEAATPMSQDGEPASSSLTHWPIQIRLIPPSAPFLKGADLLVLADCSAVTIPNLHQDLLKNRVVMLGCPKFDEAEMYVQRFTEIFETAGINSITTVYQEVPCCSGLPTIIARALTASGKMIPTQNLMVSAQGQVLKRN